MDPDGFIVPVKNLQDRRMVLILPLRQSCQIYDLLRLHQKKDPSKRGFKSGAPIGESIRTDTLFVIF